MICPKCGSNHVTTQTYTDTETSHKVKGFSCFKACLGYMFFDIPGILCGLCGSGKEKHKTTTHTKVVHICQSCGKHF